VTISTRPLPGDFPGSADAIAAQLAEATDSERVQAAIVLWAAGDYGRPSMPNPPSTRTRSWVGAVPGGVATPGVPIGHSVCRTLACLSVLARPQRPASTPASTPGGQPVEVAGPVRTQIAGVVTHAVDER
jgi:hypothetical protein